MTFNFKSPVTKFYNKTRSHFIEYHFDLDLCYVVESKTNRVLQICSLQDLKNEIVNRDNIK